MQSHSICVLFLCTGNSARSQMAEALLCDLGGPDFTISSAGVLPASRVQPLAIAALAEIGIDWSGARTKSVAEFAGSSFDYVITLCETARERCPVFPGQYTMLHWDLEDPSTARGSQEERLEVFRATRRQLTHMLEPFMATAREVYREALTV
jgi:arsenate reductase